MVFKKSILCHEVAKCEYPPVKLAKLGDAMAPHNISPEVG